MLEELPDGVRVEAVQAQPNPKPPFLPFPWGNIISPQCIQEKQFSPKVAQCGGGVEHNQASSRSPPLLSFPLLFSHSFGAELSVVYAQPHFGFT